MNSYTLDSVTLTGLPLREEYSGDLATVRARALIVSHFGGGSIVTVSAVDGDRAYPILRTNGQDVEEIAPPAPAPSAIDKLNASFDALAKKLGGQ